VVFQHGAKVIYDTDDDNAPHTDFHGFDVPAHLTIATAARAYNPLPHFGQSSVWPRGYPLDKIGEPAPRTYTLCNRTHSQVLVKQGLVNGDPDVDAIFRLTRKSTSRDLDIQFDASAPPVVLPAGTFTPYNSQNTVVTYDALWSLLLPRTVTMRVTDIWRAYWAQPLMWLIGGTLAYYPPAVTQRRNAHSYLNDAGQEAGMYSNTSRLIDYLSTWRCTQAFPQCAMQLTIDMTREQFWGREEIPLYHAWIEDLYRMGYRFPKLRHTPCSTRQNVTCYPQEQPTSLNHQSQLIDLNINKRKPLCSELFNR
jgi:hypothetical protein